MFGQIGQRKGTDANGRTLDRMHIGQQIIEALSLFQALAIGLDCGVIEPQHFVFEMLVTQTLLGEMDEIDRAFCPSFLLRLTLFDP
jgi:hypothetical protein